MKYHYFNQCDMWRTKFPNGEKDWQEMMDNKKPIPISMFKERVDFCGLLDEDDENDTIELFVDSDPSHEFFISSVNGNKILFVQTCGYEFIFTADGEEPAPKQPKCNNGLEP